VLFYGEAPGEGDAVGVVLDIEEIAPEIADGAVASDEHAGHEDVVRGPDLEAATDEEAAGFDASAELPFLDEESADEEAGEDEEEVYAEPAEVLEAEELEGCEEPAAG